MNPIALVVGAGAAGWGLFKALGKKPAVQVQTVSGAGGVPVKIITPVAPITPAQKAGVSAPPAATRLAVAQTVPNKGVVFAPPKAIVATSEGPQPSPIIATPTGSSSLVIASVADVQRALNTLGYASPALKDDGKLGPKTIASIRAFQSKTGLVVDGNAGPATKAALSNALSHLAGGGTGAVTPANPPTPPGKRDPYNDNWAAPKTPPTAADASGASKMTLRDIQRALNLLGANPKLKEDGASGPMTVAAIKSFQLGHGLAADGIAGPATKNIIYQLAHAPVKQFSGQFSGSFG